MRKSIFPVLAIILVGGGYLAYAQQAPNDAVPTAIPAQSAPLGAPKANLPSTKIKGTAERSYLIKDAPLRTDFLMGKADAPIVMVEYASLSCPHCAKFSSEVLPELEKKYIQTGKVVYVLRQFPLNDPALRGAMLLDCVGESSADQYYVFSRVLFDAQKKWAFDTNFLTALETIATVGGVSREQFKKCTTDTDREMKVLQAKKTAIDELKIPHTPFIYIAGEAYEGDKSVEAISTFIDDKIATTKK